MAEKDYEGFIETGVDTDDVHEPTVQPTGAYDLVITSAKGVYAEKPDGGGQYLKSVRVLIDFTDVKNAKTIFHTLTLWNAEEEAKKREYKIILAKKLYKLFGVPFSNRGLNTTDLVGAKATSVLVDQTMYDKKDGSEPQPSNQLNLNNIHV